MLKKTITYTDYNGESRTEDFYFNLNSEELLHMQIGVDGGYDAAIQGMVGSKDIPKIYETFRNFVLSSYGEKTPDGKYFLKKKNGERLSEYFEQCQAYEVLMDEIMSSIEAANTFLAGILPAEVAAQFKTFQAQQAKQIQG